MKPEDIKAGMKFHKIPLKDLAREDVYKVSF